MDTIEALRETYPFHHKFLIEAWGGNKAIIRPNGSYACGYVAIENARLPKAWWGRYNIDDLELLNVHGGITYAESNHGYTIFGFDCAHAGDESREELCDTEVLKQLTEQMEQQVHAFAARYDEYMNADSKGRLAIVDEVRKTGELSEEPATIALFCRIMSGVDE